MSLVRRRSLLVTLLMGVALGPFLAPASAQAGEPYFRVDASMDPPPAITQRFGEVTVTMEITVTSDNSNPLTDQVTLLVSVNRTRPNPVPNGWAVSDVSPASFEMAPGETKTVEFTVKLQVEDPEAASIDVAFQVRAEPQLDQAPQPVTDPLFGALAQESTTTAQTTVRRNLEPAEAVTSFVFQYKWLLIAVVAAIIIVLGLLLRKRQKVGIVVSTDQGVQEVVPGRGASFPLTVANVGTNRETLTLGTSDVPNGWSAILPVDRLELRGAETTTIWLTLKSPSNARPGERVQVAFLATTSDGSGYETMLEASVVESYADATGATPAAPEEVSEAPATRARRKPA